MRAGERLDLVPFGYRYRGELPSRQNPSVTQWLAEGAPDVVAGVMWEEHRPVDRIEFEFTGTVCDPSRLLLEVTTNTPTDTQDNRPTWWTRKPEPFPGRASRGGDDRTVIFQTDLRAIERSLEGYPDGFRYQPDARGMVLIDTLRLRCPDSGLRPVVSSVRAYGAARVSSLQIEIEWGLRAGDDRRDFSGSIEVYNGYTAGVRPLEGASGTTTSGSCAWKSLPSPARPRGIAAELWFVAQDTQEVRFTPATFLPVGNDGILSYHPDRTVVTVRTASGSFSFAPVDLESGRPLVVPSLGFSVSRRGCAPRTELHPRSVRQRVRAMPEQSFARALADHYSDERPPMPRPEVDAPMGIDVPDALAAQAWRLAYWHVQRRCLPDADGVYQIVIWPYRALLGQESWRIFYALDLLGEHRITRSGFLPWLRSQGTVVARGWFDGPDGALNVPGWDLNHAQGHGSMLFALAEHALLTGDVAWAAEHRQNLTDACEWIARQRRHWVARVGANAWPAGLLPPGEFGDYADWRCLYQTNVFAWRALLAASQALRAVDPADAERYRAEAEEFRTAIRRAVERSVELAPVVRVADGTFRRYIPPHPYLRGRSHQIANPYSGGHAGALVMDSECGAAALGLGVLPDDDPVIDELLDVLEDDLYLDNWVVRTHARERRAGDPESWFSIGGYYYQCGYSQSALVHLRRDDVPNYLRSMINQYAADVDPANGYQFREHPNRAGEGNGGDKTFEAAAFLERMRAMFVMEDGDRLWLARGTPRAWLEPGKRIAIGNAPSHFGTVAYEIVSDSDRGAISATVAMPSRDPPGEVVIRLRHPLAARMELVMVDGRPWQDVDRDGETIRLSGVRGTVKLEARYGGRAR